MLDPFTRHLHNNAGRHGPLALMYHSVQQRPATPAWPWAISLGQFEDHLDFLRDEGWTTRTVRELVGQPSRPHPRTVAITFDDGFVDNLLALEALVRRGMRASWFIVTGAIGRTPDWPDTGRPSGRMLDADELRALAEAGMEVGSHSHRHARLPSLDVETTTEELVRSRAILEDILGRPVESFSYPYGDWDERCETAVRAAGYDAACTTMTGVALRDGHPLRIRRLSIFNQDTSACLARKLGSASNEGDWSSAVRYVARRIGARVGIRS